MPWQDRYLPGTFRKVPFVTERHSFGGGRRVALHQYPRRDEPYAEDMGRGARSFQLELFVRGPDYMVARDRLIAAFEAPGPGTLDHPYLGSLKVVAVTSFRVTESTAEGGIARFSVDFVEAGENALPTSTANTPHVVETRVAAAEVAVTQQFVAAFTLDNQPEFVATSALEKAQSAILKLQALAGAGPALIAEKTSYLRSLASSLSGLSATVRSPSALASGLMAQVRALASLWPFPATAVERYQSLSTFGSDFTEVNPVTPSRLREAQNQTALVQLMRQAAVIQSAQASRRVVFDSAEAAAVMREDIAEQLDLEMMTADDLTYPVLADLRVAVVQDITARGASLARVTQYRPTATLPALVIAHGLYGDAAQETLILERNRSVRHPGFVTGGQPLEVLTHA